MHQIPDTIRSVIDSLGYGFVPVSGGRWWWELVQVLSCWIRVWLQLHRWIQILRRQFINMVMIPLPPSPVTTLTNSSNLHSILLR